jgi:hypothetical protein
VPPFDDGSTEREMKRGPARKSHVEDNLDLDYEKNDKRYPPGFNKRIIAGMIRRGKNVNRKKS